MTRNSFYTPSSFFGGGGRRIPFTGPLVSDRFLQEAELVVQQNPTIEEYQGQATSYPHGMPIANIIDPNDPYTSPSLRHTFQEIVAEDNRESHENVSAEERLQANLAFENELFGLEYKFKERLFAWCPFKLYDDCIAKYLAVRWFLVLSLMAIYSVGLGCFILLNQRVEMCDIGMLKASKTNTSCQCAGEAEKCKFGNEFITFKSYVQYRLIAYFCLLIPFLYFPYMTVLDISRTAGKIWEKIRMEPLKNQRRILPITDIGEHFGNTDRSRLYYGAKYAKHCCVNLTAVQHEWVLLILFIIFHVIMGAFSTAFDYLVMSHEYSVGSPCQILNTHLTDIGNDIKIPLRESGMYNFAMGIILFALTLVYIVFQFATSCFRHEKMKQQKNLIKHLRENTANQRTKDLITKFNDARDMTRQAFNERSNLLNQQRAIEMKQEWKQNKKEKSEIRAHQDHLRKLREAEISAALRSGGGGGKGGGGGSSFSDIQALRKKAEEGYQ